MQCPFNAYISLILGLEPASLEPPITPDMGTFNLIWGDCFHTGLEWLIRTGDHKLASEHMFDKLASHPEIVHPDIEIRTSLFHMLKQYNLDFIEYSTLKWETEVIFDTAVDTPPPFSSYAFDSKYRFRGKFDGITRPERSRPTLLEHKCKGNIYPQQIREELKHDTQINLYMDISGAREVFYDLIKIPEAAYKYATPTRLVRESKKDYTNKLYYGHCGKYSSLPISRYSQDWIHQELHVFTNESVEAFWKMTFLPLCDRLAEWYEYVTQPNFDPLNPSHYNSIFYRQPLRTFIPSATSTFKGKFHALTTQQIELTDLQPRTLFNELKE